MQNANEQPRQRQQQEQRHGHRSQYRWILSIHINSTLQIKHAIFYYRNYNLLYEL